MDVGYEKVDSSDRNGSEGDVVFMLSRFLGKLANGSLPAHFRTRGGGAEIHRHAPALSNDFGLIGSGRRVDGSKPDDFLARLTACIKVSSEDQGNDVIGQSLQFHIPSSDLATGHSTLRVSARGCPVVRF